MSYYTDRSRTTFNDMSHMPVKTVKVNEGTVTRMDAIEATGGTTPVITYVNPLIKGDLVVIDSLNSKGGNIVVRLRDPLKDSYANGISVSSPRGTDSNTDTGSLPDVSDMRVVDIVWFAAGIMELVANTNITAGNDVEFSRDKGFENYIETFGSTAGHNGAMIALSSVNEGEYCPILMGVYGYDENTTTSTVQSKKKSKKNSEEE